MTATRGQRRHLVTLENPGDPIPDGGGGYIETWAPLSPPTRMAEIKPATARDLERVVANTVESTASHILTMDYHPQLTTETRITFGTRVFTVDGKQNPDELNVDLVLAVTEVVS
jgi:head-tail adaptor